MADELTHTIQAKQTGTTAPMAGVLEPRHSAAETEADAMAERVAAVGPGVKLPPVVAAPAASVQLAPAQGEPKREAAVPAVHDAAATSSQQPTSEPLNAERYWAKYGQQTMRRALDRAMAELVFEITGPGLAFPTGECGAFIMSSLGWRMQDTAPHHVSQLLDTPIYELIDGVRVLDDRDRGPDAFEPAVVSRIVERLGLGIRHAIARLALPYAKARSRTVSAAKRRGATRSAGAWGRYKCRKGIQRRRNRIRTRSVRARPSSTPWPSRCAPGSSSFTQTSSRSSTTRRSPASRGRRSSSLSAGVATG